MEDNGGERVGHCASKEKAVKDRTGNKRSNHLDQPCSDGEELAKRIMQSDVLKRKPKHYKRSREEGY